MQVQQRHRYGFSDLVEDAGIGLLAWNRASYFTATYYHHIVALFTTVILFVSILRLWGWQIALLLTLPYVLYFLGRTRLSQQDEKKFYTPRIQFLRAQISFLAVTFLIGLVPGAEQTSLWLLYLPIFLLTSKHCSTYELIFLVIETGTVLALIRIWHNLPVALSSDFLYRNLDLGIQLAWLGFLAFIQHFLVRHIQARTETIAAHHAVNALAAGIGMTEVRGVYQWQPLLIALLKYLGGECASAWVSNMQTRRLQLVASARRHPQNHETIIADDSPPVLAVPLDHPTLIARAACTGEPQHSILDPKSNRAACACPGCNPLCQNLSVELVVPINLGTNEQRSTIGVLSVGFAASSFHKRMLPQYQTFMQGIVNQAKPMLVYAQRLEELLALQKISRQVSHSLDLNQVLDSILKAIVDTLGFEFATISLVDEERQIIYGARGINVPPKWLEMAVHSLHSTDIQADIVRTGKTEVIAGWDARFDRRIWSKFGHADMIRVFAPIGVMDNATNRERIIGTIEAGYHRANRAEISAEQLRMLEAFESQASMAIEQAQLLMRIQKKADILASLHRVGQVIASARQLDHVLKEIVQNAADLLHADIVMLYRYHRETHTVDLPVIYGQVGKKFRLNLDLNQENILTRLLSKTQPYYRADAQSDPLLNISPTGEASQNTKSKYTFIQRHNIKSFAGIPLIAQGEIVGVMFINYRARHQFDTDEKQVHELFAQQAAVAIKNAEINELEREVIIREERNHLSRELHDSVSQALFGIQLQAQNALKCPGAQHDEQLRADLANIADIAHLASNETCFIIDELRAPIDESRHLLRGLEEYSRRISKWYGLEVSLQFELRQPILPALEQRLLRFAREALNNAVRHAQCHTIAVSCQSNAEHFLLSIRDDGKGFDPDRIPPHKLGIAGMREIAAEVGGLFSLETQPGSGTQVSLLIMSEEGASDYE